jgi:hypothetical protein
MSKPVLLNGYMFATRWQTYLKVIAAHREDDEQTTPTDPTDPNQRILTEGGDFINTEGGDRLIL